MLVIPKLKVVSTALAFQNDPMLHPRVRVQLVKTDETNEADMLSIVMRLNRYTIKFPFIILMTSYLFWILIHTFSFFNFLFLFRLNDTGYVQTSYTDMLWMVRAMGLASKESLMEKIPFTVYTWLQTDIERKVGKKAWYNVPVAIMSQLLHPVSVNLSTRVPC